MKCSTKGAALRKEPHTAFKNKTKQENTEKKQQHQNYQNSNSLSVIYD